MDKTTPHPLFKLATELGPLIVFFVANAKFNLFVATGAFMVAIVAAMIASYVVTRHVPMMALVTGVIVIVFGTLTLVLHDETFIKIKPTIIYGLFAAILGGGLLFGRSFIAIMFDQMFNLTPQGWRILTLRWALFFFAMAILNEIIWRTQSTDFWVAFKAFGVMPLTMAVCDDADAADQALPSGAGLAGSERGGSGRCDEGVKARACSHPSLRGADATKQSQLALRGGLLRRPVIALRCASTSLASGRGDEPISSSAWR